MPVRILPLALAAVSLAACSEAPQQQEPEVAFVHLFEWKWSDVARECEENLGPAGYTAVQVSPPNEHITGPAWWTRYQPVSYKIESRGGTREEFADMVARCKAAGVDIYADAVINHMADIGAGVGVAGSGYGEFDYPVPYGYDDFHHCGRNDDGRIANYQDQWEVQNCQLGLLADINTGKPEVQAKIAAYLNELLSLGVAGFRLDAVKHIHHDEVERILAGVDGEPFIFQEVIDRGGEPIKAKSYLKNGSVTEFRYAGAIIEAFELGNLAPLNGLGTDPDWLLSNQAIVFVDNHDSQRSHLGNEVLNYKDGARYDLAVAFMLAYPYGYPMVMSSYAFEDDDQGPPASSPNDPEAGCGNAWVCEHRHETIAEMVGFRQSMHGEPLVNWQIVDGTVISFGRGDKGHVVINTGTEPVRLELPTKMPNANYGDAQVDDGILRTTVDASGVIVIQN